MSDTKHMTPLNLPALRAACDWVDRLAPGPWRINWTGDNPCGEGNDEESAGIDGIVDANGEDVVIADSGVYPPHGRVASFIALAREGLPAALARIEELEQRIATIADEGCGIAPVESADASLTRIEGHLFGLRVGMERQRNRADAAESIAAKAKGGLRDAWKSERKKLQNALVIRTEEVERLRVRVATLEESLDNTCEQCDGACPHRKEESE